MCFNFEIIFIFNFSWLLRFIIILTKYSSSIFTNAINYIRRGESWENIFFLTSFYDPVKSNPVKKRYFWRLSLRWHIFIIIIWIYFSNQLCIFKLCFYLDQTYVYTIVTFMLYRNLTYFNFSDINQIFKTSESWPNNILCKSPPPFKKKYKQTKKF